MKIITPSHITPTSPLWLSAAALLSRRGIEFFVLWKCTRHTADRESVRALSAAAWQLRESLNLFGPCYRDADRALIARKLKHLTGRLQELRTLETCDLLVQRHPGAVSPGCHDALAVFRQQLGQDRTREIRRLHRYLRKAHRESLAVRYYKFCYTPDLFGRSVADPLMPGRDYLRHALRSTLADTALIAAFTLSGSDTGAELRWQRGIRRLRTRLEIVTSLEGTLPKHELQTLGRYQEILERLRDLEACRELAGKRLTGAAARGLHDIIMSERSRSRDGLATLQQAHPWELLTARIGEIL